MNSRTRNFILVVTGLVATSLAQWDANPNGVPFIKGVPARFTGLFFNPDGTALSGGTFTNAVVTITTNSATGGYDVPDNLNFTNGLNNFVGNFSLTSGDSFAGVAGATWLWTPGKFAGAFWRSDGSGTGTWSANASALTNLPLTNLSFAVVALVTNMAAEKIPYRTNAAGTVYYFIGTTNAP